jgi:predicted Zn-dependent protease
VFQWLKDWFERWRALRELRADEGEDNHGYIGFFSEQIHFETIEFGAGRREKALQLWRAMNTRFPDLSIISKQALNLLLDLACHDEAETLIQAGRARNPRYESVFAVVFARIAYSQGDLNEAIRRYEAVRRTFPQLAEGYVGAATCLVDLGRLDEAEALIGRGVQKFPDDFNLHMRYAQTATRRLDWSEGLQRWTL